MEGYILEVNGKVPSGGTGQRFGRAIITLTGVAALSATLLTFFSVWLQAKNYRKPLLQRYVVRILWMVPIYSAVSWASLVSLRAAFWIEPFLDVYEAFTIYTFLQLLVNFIGGERSLIILTYGRPPIPHLWPLGYCLPKVDISDPHTFLAVKRGILQYAWLKPILAVATIVMKATGTYQEGYIGLKSGYFWSGLVYNISITVSLYSLAMFWVCMSEDLQPFRPMPKFLCIKGIIFASYWQGFFLSILVWLGAIPDTVPGYTPDNLAASIQDALLCFEMPIFALSHWYAFSWHDYADPTISAARLPVRYALRDAFGPKDLIQDTKDTFGGKQYEYRQFDADDNVLAHEASGSRTARLMDGMRYERGGKGKYWIAQPKKDSHTPLLQGVLNSRARALSPGPKLVVNGLDYGTDGDGTDAPALDPEDETLFSSARALEFGDYNYPVITAHTATREDRLTADPSIITGSTNRHLLQPTKDNKKRRKSRIQNLKRSADKGSHGKSNESGPSTTKAKKQSVISTLFGQEESSSNASKTDRSQLVDLVVEDHEAEQVERVRAKKEGGPGWNEHQPKHFVRLHPDEGEQEVVRLGFEPDETQPHKAEGRHNLDKPVTENGAGSDGSDGNKSRIQTEADEAALWQDRDYDRDADTRDTPAQQQEDNPWDSANTGNGQS